MRASGSVGLAPAIAASLTRNQRAHPIAAYAWRTHLLQVMEEIIAKSKMYKAIKAKQREEDEDELEKVTLRVRCWQAEPTVARRCCLEERVDKQLFWGS